MNDAESIQQSYISFLNNLLAAELDYRIEKKYNRDMTGAHFPVVKEINTFEFGNIKDIAKTDISQLLEFVWLDNRMNILLFGPPRPILQ